MRVEKLNSASMRGLYLSIVVAFSFFLASSAPHRVHHLFDQYPAADTATAAKHAHDHSQGGEQPDHHHHKRRNPQSTDCFVLTLAENVHASVVQSFSFTPVELAVTYQQDRVFGTAFAFNPAPFSQRAPPLA